MGRPVDDWKKKPLEELYEEGFVNDLEGWTKNLDSPVPNRLVFLLVNELVNEIRKSAKGVEVAKEKRIPVDKKSLPCEI